jgi:hypothetical protein
MEDYRVVVVLRSGPSGANASARLYEATAAPAVAVLSIWDEAVRNALRAGKTGPVDATISAHIPVPLHQGSRSLDQEQFSFARS